MGTQFPGSLADALEKCDLWQSPRYDPEEPKRSLCEREGPTAPAPAFCRNVAVMADWMVEPLPPALRAVVLAVLQDRLCVLVARSFAVGMAWMEKEILKESLR